MALLSAHFELSKVGVQVGSVRALDGVDLTLTPGEAVAFVGPSGAGKTTLLRLLNGSRRATEGSVKVGGRDLRALNPKELRRLRAQVGFVHQELHLLPTLRVVKNVLAGRLGQQSLLASMRSLLFPPKTQVLGVYMLLSRVGIADKLYQRTDSLSGGQRQRVAVARALYQGPVALLADEPVSAVDPARARDTVELLLSVSRERGLTLAMSLHNLDLAKELFPRIVGLRAGKVVFDGPPDALTPRDWENLYDLSALALHERAG